jgi:hypothetical protein
VLLQAATAPGCLLAQQQHVARQNARSVAAAACLPKQAPLPHDEHVRVICCCNCVVAHHVMHCARCTPFNR